MLRLRQLKIFNKLNNKLYVYLLDKKLTQRINNPILLDTTKASFSSILNHTKYNKNVYNCNESNKKTSTKHYFLIDKKQTSIINRNYNHIETTNLASSGNKKSFSQTFQSRKDAKKNIVFNNETIANSPISSITNNTNKENISCDRDSPSNDPDFNSKNYIISSNTIHSGEKKTESNYFSNLYMNSAQLLANKEAYFMMMEQQKFFSLEELDLLRKSQNPMNAIFCIKFFIYEKFNMMSLIYEFSNLYNVIDDEVVLMLLKKIFKNIHCLGFEQYDRVCLIILKKNIRDIEILQGFKKLVILNHNQISYANIGSLIVFCSRMGLLTNDTHLAHFYSELVTSALIRLNYNDFIYSFEALAKLNNVSPYIWQIIENFIVRKFNKLYRINSLRRLVSTLSDKNLYNSNFWHLTDKYILYNAEKIPQMNIILELITNVKKNLGYCSLNDQMQNMYFIRTMNRKVLRDFKLIAQYVEEKFNAPELNDAGKGIGIAGSEGILNKSPQSFNKGPMSNSNGSSNDTSNNREKVKNYFKSSLENEVHILEFEFLEFLFDKNKNYLQYYNTSGISNKVFSLLIQRFESFSFEEKYKIYFEMGKYDKRFVEYSENLKIFTNKNNLLKMKFNEFYFSLIVNYLKKYEDEPCENVKELFSVLKSELNEFLSSDLDTKYYELFIALIPYNPSLLKLLDADLKKKKLNKIINSFMEYKNSLFLKKKNLQLDLGSNTININPSAKKESGSDSIQSDVALTDKAAKGFNTVNKSVACTATDATEGIYDKENMKILRKINKENEAFDYDKLIILKILNDLNPKKLNLSDDLLYIITNAENIYVDISQSKLIQIISLCLNLSIQDIEQFYKMKFHDSVYDKYIQ